MVGEWWVGPSAYGNRIIFNDFWSFHTGSQKVVSRDSVFYVVFAKLFIFLTIFNLCSGQEHLYPVPSSSVELISHWCSQNICWLNKWRHTCVSSLCRIDLIWDNWFKMGNRRNTTLFVSVGDNIFLSFSL